MRHSEFFSLLEGEFGAARAGSLADQHVLRELDGQTATEALAAGVPPRTVWLALCEDLDVPPVRRLGKEHLPRRWGGARSARSADVADRE